MVFSIYCNRVGPSTVPGRSVDYLGESAIIHPNGTILAEAEKGLTKQLIIGTIDFSEIEETKASYNYLEERRPELY